MTTFTYTAVDKSGATRSGTLEAGSRAAVSHLLHQLGVVPIDVREQRASALMQVRARWQASHRPSRRDVLMLMQQLAALLRAGITLDRALSIARSLCESAAMRTAVEDLLQAVRRGASLSQALSRHAMTFDATLVGLVAAGEAGGTLPDVMHRVALWLQRSDQARERIRSALIYPAILLAVMLLTLVLVVTVVLPRFESLFLEARQSLPWATRAVLTFGRAATDFAPVWIGALLALTVVAQQLWTRPKSRVRIDAFLLSARGFGGLVSRVETARVLGTCATLVASGIVLPKALRLSADTSGNRAMRAALERVVVQLREGGSLSRLLGSAMVFPPLAVQLVQVGEETGRLESMLQQTADILDQDAQVQIERGLALIVPITTVLMGVLVAGLIGSVLVGILSVNELAL